MMLAAMDSIIACSGLSKVYGSGSLAETVLSGVDLALRRGEACVLVGPSGSGKTTLLSILGCLLSPTSGRLEIEGRPVDFTSQGLLVELRRRSIGFIFQRSQLLSFLTVSQNLTIVGKNAGLSRPDLDVRIASLAAALDIEAALPKRPDQLSGGQRQRAAIARAVLHHPAIVLADEPTASLDRANGEAVINLLTARARAENTSLLTVTHDTRLLNQFDRVYRIENGKLLI
jgi:ABC-type lipoprotein export system ATPase subunit